MKRVDGIRAVTYDCWGTLLKDRDWEGAMSRRAGALSHLLGLSESEATALLEEAWAKHDEAWHQVETFGPGRMAAYCLEKHGIDDEQVYTDLSREFEEATLVKGADAVDGALETIEALHRANLGVGLICDTGLTPARVVRELLDSVDLLDGLDFQCFSDEIGVPKPGNEIFAKALAECGCRPPEAIHIGDLKRTDIAGAHDIGMHAARYRGVHDDKSDYMDAHIILDRHQQLLDVIGLSE